MLKVTTLGISLWMAALIAGSIVIAQEPAEDGGRRIVIATDRPIGFWEARNQPRTIEYPFTVIRMHIDKNGEGKGTMSYATKIIPRGISRRRS